MDESQGQTADTNFVRTVSWPSCFEAAKLDKVIVLREKMYLFDFQVIFSKVKCCLLSFLKTFDLDRDDKWKMIIKLATLVDARKKMDDL